MSATRRVRCLEEIVAAAEIDLTHDELKVLDAAAPTGAADGDCYSAGMMEQVGR